MLRCNGSFRRWLVTRRHRLLQRGGEAGRRLEAILRTLRQRFQACSI
jgi:hypothetical protein